MIIALDAGHGGKDPGCHGNGLVEKDLVLELAGRVGHLLRARNLSTVMTRTRDLWVPINNRPKIARLAGAGAFISLHADAGPAESARGVTAFYAEPDSRSSRFAGTILKSIRKACGSRLPIRGVKPDTSTHVKRLGVLRGSCEAMPAVLLECGFLTSPLDSALLKDNLFKETLCIGIAEGILCGPKSFTEMSR